MVKKEVYDVFLSHNSADKSAVEELARRLVKEGLNPWLDKWNLIPGETWQPEIEKALDNCTSCAVFIGPSGAGPWQNEEMRAAIDRRVREGHLGKRSFRVIPVLLPRAERVERSLLPTFLSATTWVEFRRTLDDEQAFYRLLCGIRGIPPGLGPDEVSYEGKNPYRGLQFFDVEHAPFFFGREALTEWLLNELQPSPSYSARLGNRFLGIIGPSGSGKSSLARAGLIAALKQGEIEGSSDWPIAICRPGPDPLESLAVALSNVINIGQSPSDLRNLIKDLHDDKQMLHLATRLALRSAPAERRLVLLVDQFEEIFTLCPDDKECLRRAFLDNLLYAASVAGGQTVVILTLRADFYGKCAVYPNLAAALSDHQELVGPMTPDELRRAIEQPAQLAGAEFETGLAEKLLHDIENQSGGLPLLQHALLELWERRRGRYLTHEAYEAIGGIGGALEQRAEMVYQQFTEPEQEICRRIFLRLTKLGEGTEDTKRQASLPELVPVGGGTEQVEAVIQKLASAEARLVTTRADETLKGGQFVEVSHEALIQGWTRLRVWIEEDRTALRTHQQLTAAAIEWEKNNRDESYLYRGPRLAGAREWAETHANELNELEQTFLDKSQIAFEEAQQEKEAARQAIQRKRRLELQQQITARMVRAGLDPDEVLELVAQAVNESTQSDLTSIYLYDQEATNFTRGVQVRGNEQVVLVDPKQLPDLDEFPAQIAQNQQALFVGNVQTNPEVYSFAIRHNFQAFAGLPLTTVDAQGMRTTVGVLLVNFEQPHPFSDDEQEILHLLANQAAVAIAYASAQASAQAREQLAALGTAAATLQHRLGNTINVILPAVLRLRYRLGEDETNAQILDAIERNALFAIEVIRRMQTPLRSESLVRTNINSLIRDAVHKCLQEKERFPQARLSTNLPEIIKKDPIDAADESKSEIRIMVELDEYIPDTFLRAGQITEVIRVLIENGAKAIHPLSGMVRVKCYPTGDLHRPCVEITVTDTGKGIDEKTKARLFKQPVPRREFGQGAGLGLWLSYFIVRNHQGNLDLRATEVGKGSTFVIRLPILDRPPLEASPREES